MPPVLLASSAYLRPDNPELIVQNMRYEQDPANTEDQNSLAGRPGLVLWKTPGSSAVAGLFVSPLGSNTIILGVQGTSSFGYTVGGTSIANATATISLNGAVTFANVGDPASVKIAFSGGLTLYSYDFTLGVGTVSFPDSADVSSIDAIAGRFVATRSATQQFYWSDVNSTTFDALSFASAESESDQLVCVKAIGSELWLFGRSSIEVWQPAANPDLPFQPIVGRTFAYGCINRATVAKLENTLFWVGRQERIVLQTAPNPQRISDPAIEALLRGADETELNGFIASDEDGHLYYVLNMGAKGSWAYDATTKRWARWKTNSRVDFEGRYASSFGDGRFIVGDVSGNVNFLSADAVDDNGEVIDKRFSGWIDIVKTTRCTNVILDCTVGGNTSQLAQAYISMRWSDNRGKTWNVWRDQPLGYQGDYDLLMNWNTIECQLGHMSRPGRLFEWRTSEKQKFMVRTAKFNERP